MRIAYISDVHANIVALKEVVHEIDRLGIEVVVNAGDLIGYYPFPNETVRFLRERKVISIRGNHDRSVLSANTNRMNLMASAAVRWTSMHIDRDTVGYLHKLKDKTDILQGNVRMSVHHGSPFDEDEYVMEKDVDEGLLDACPGSKVLVLGHTHVPYVVHLDRGFVINPGSVGQPRDGDPRASFIVHDTTKGIFDVRRVEYDIAVVEEEVLKEGLPQELVDRLWRGA